MSLLQNKRNRDDSLNDSNSTLKENIFQINQFKNCFDIIKNNENILEEMYSNNINNNTNDIFQKMFKSINSRKDDYAQNNIIMSPLMRSNLFIDSFKNFKNFGKISASNDKSKIPFPRLNSSIFNKKISPNNKNKFIFSPFSSFKLEKNLNCEEFLNNNVEKFPLKLDFCQNNFSEKNSIFEFNSDKKINQDNINLLEVKQHNFFDNKLFNNTNNTSQKNNQSSDQKGKSHQLSSKKDYPKMNPINTCLFNSVNDNKNTINKSDKIFEKNKSNKHSFNSYKPFQTYNPKIIKKINKNESNNNNNNSQKKIKPKVFHIEKIFNKKEYKDAHEKEDNEEEINNINRFKISLKKIKQIYINSCLKIYTYFNKNTSFNESYLTNELFLSNIKNQIIEIIKAKKITSSKMNQILQVNDDDKYRKHYFMFTSEAKEFCLNLIKKKNLPFDVVMKMCKVPRKSLRRWLFVGCQRKKGCGRKTKNPEMEEKLVKWYKEITAVKKDLCITAKMIRDKAMKISKDKDFLASKGWLEKFKKKYNIQIESNRNKKIKRSIFYDKINHNNKNPEEKGKIDYEINIIKNNEEEKKDNENKNS
jgi:hypothetical protein